MRGRPLRSPVAVWKEPKVTRQRHEHTSPSVASARSLLKAGRVSEALEMSENLVSHDTDDIEARYINAVCLRYLDRPDEATIAIHALLKHQPKHARAYQELGHLAKSRGHIEEAVSSYDQATRLNPALLASWSALLELSDKNSSGHQHAAAHLDRLTQLAPELLSAESMMHEGKLFKAEQLCRQYLKNRPKDVEGMRLLALLGMKLNIFDDAEFLLESALTFDPSNVQARFDYVSVLHRRQKFEKSFSEARKLLDLDKDNPAFLSAYANEALAIGHFDEALQIYDTLSSSFPDMPLNHLVRGHALKTVGRREEAEKSYQRAYKVQSDLGDAYWSLANLKTYQFSEDEFSRMREAEKASTTSIEDRIHLCFALGKGLEDRKRFDESFSYYERGNSLKRNDLQYDPERMESEFDAQKKLLTKKFFSTLPEGGSSSDAPIFIVGLPRAGSTLLEQILSSHSQVEGTLELPNILALVHRLNGRRKLGDAPRYPAVLGSLTPQQREEFGNRYIEETKIHRRSAPRFTDKMPNNFRHIGLIHMMLPNAKIIDARRDPMACCFSGFKQLFAEGQEFTYGLEDIGKYYQGYVDLMKHWDDVLPGKILRVQYENIVSDLETQVRRLLDFLDLPFEEACLDFHKTERSVRTASSEQVRQPLYSSGVDQWRHFEHHLDPLKSALGPALEEYLS